MIGTASLPDGSKIVTYNKMPLYYWVKDTKPGDTTGQGVGDVWYVVSPDGKVVDSDASSAAAAPAAAEATISVATDAKLGKILVGDKGMTLYMFTKDGPNQSNCNADCLAKWPPLLTQGSPTLGEGVDAAWSAQQPCRMAPRSSPTTRCRCITGSRIPRRAIPRARASVKSGMWSLRTAKWWTAMPSSAVQRLPRLRATISVATDAKLGKILVGDKGMTLYMFTKDGPDQSNCNAECLAKWPPLLTQGNPTLGEGVDASLVGTASLPDGSKIVTYNKMPLYYWVKDTKAGRYHGSGCR